MASSGEWGSGEVLIGRDELPTHADSQGRPICVSKPKLQPQYVGTLDEIASKIIAHCRAPCEKAAVCFSSSFATERQGQLHGVAV